MFADVCLEAGAVENDLGLQRRSRSVLLGDRRQHAVRARAHVGDLALIRLVPTLFTPTFHLVEPVLPVGRMGAAGQFVQLLAVFALELQHLLDVLATPRALRGVETLERKSICAASLGPTPLVVPSGIVRPEQMQDFGLCALVLAVIHQSLQDTRRNDAPTADQHRSWFGQEPFVDVFVRFVGVDGAGQVLVLAPVFLQIVQELQAWVADREVHELAAIGDPSGGRGAGRGSENREIAAGRTPANHSHLAIDEHLVVPDACGFFLQTGEHGSGTGRPVVGEDRLGEHVPDREQLLFLACLAQGVAGKAPDVVRHALAVAA